ncbi:vacuolar protein sorting-associated protein 51 homolog [Lytechinus variegatus]|uniref:vacuolar protein sorting-associated protein 51 homolog n=2 Tax=Lytechinus TaxID=7652 RepID=UPI001BB0E091|nr:vacuolar protein sorting-associated protein 51 homolog [Lytechinus variegatus]
MSEGSSEGGAAKSRKKHGMLKMYYGLDDQQEKPSNMNPTDINGAYFNPEVYLTMIMKEKRLNDLIDKEAEMVKQIRSLDSDMQTLVYENYNKFISATDTIRKMKTDFKKMEEEMDRLATNMDTIADFSEKISSTLQERRAQITKLSGVHSLLKKLQFLFELPARLNKCISMKAYSQAVRYYSKARVVLLQYQHMPSFHGIHRDCNEIVNELRLKLREQFGNKESDAKQLAECVDLLLQLKEPPDELCDEFLSHARHKLDESLREMSSHVATGRQRTASSPEEDEDGGDVQEGGRPSDKIMRSLPMDILEFVDSSCNGFLENICLVIASYKELFVNRQAGDSQEEEELEQVAHAKLGQFVDSRMQQYFTCIQDRIQAEKSSVENSLLVRALDRFFKRLQAVHRLLPDLKILQRGADIVAAAAKERAQYYGDGLKKHFAECITDIRQTLCAPRVVGKQSAPNLAELVNVTSSSVIDQVKLVLTSLKSFLGQDITFAQSLFFATKYPTKTVREGLLVDFLRHIFQTCTNLCEGGGEKGSAPHTLILILSRLLVDFETTHIIQLLGTCNAQFLIEDSRGLTQTSTLCSEAKDSAQLLLNHYVQSQGLQISQMLRKSVDTRDWLNTIEPRNVRAVMKRVVEDITAIDSNVGSLYEEGTRKAHSSDSSKRTYQSFSVSRQPRTQRSYTPSTTFDTSLMSNIQKLFSERIEIFSSVEFSKVSVVTGIIKISLKTFLECVRLRTFGRYGLQQIQVDTHYLNLYLWRFVSDEKLVHFLLDEIVGSAVHRCLDATLMESSIVEVICERG